MNAPPRFKRVLLKISGEALLGDQPFGIDSKVVDRIAGEIGEVLDLGVKVGLVTGGGNIFRGIEIAKKGGNRVAGDQMGMLATAMNALALHEGLERRGVPAHIFSAVPMPSICETFTQQRAEKVFRDGRVLVFAGGTGNPFFTTDSGAALRAAEMDCDALLKGTQVDGIYSADPKKDKSAVRFERLTHAEVLAKGLEVMDAAAVALARDNGIPVIVFSIRQAGAFVDILKGAGRGTIVADA
jgi:uridylate kinase